MSEVALFDAPDTTDQSTKEEAESRADRIRAGMIAVTTLPAEIKDAWERHDWSALGYITWDGYIHGEFGEHRLPMITREQRRELAVDLRSGGLSIRAIGTVLGVSVGTVSRDLTGVSNGTPEIENHRAKLAEIDNGLGIVPDRIMGADGKSYASSRPKPPVPDVDTEPATDEPDQEPEPTGEPKVMLSHEVMAVQASDEEQRRQLVATHLLCEVAVSFAQCRGTATFSRYDPTKALPGRAVTLDVLRNVRAAADEAIAVWTERGLQ